MRLMRVLVDLSDDVLQWLDQRAVDEGRSRAALVRDAVSQFRVGVELADRVRRFEEGFGAWAHRTDIGDSVEWQRRERAGSTRPWDDDYEDVKAEFPDLFDDEDDRQRQIYLDMQARRSEIDIGEVA